MAGSSLNLWRTTFSTAAKKMLNSSGDNPRPCRSPCSTSNQSKQTPSSGRTQALIPSWNCRMTAIICGAWYSDAREYLPQEGAVNDVVSFLEIYETHMEGHSCLPPNFLQPANHKHHVRGRAIRSEPALLLR